MSRNGLKPLHRGDVRTDARTHARARARPPTCGGIRDIRSEPVGGRGEKHLAKHDLSSALRLLHQRQHLNSANTHSKRLHPSRWPRADGQNKRGNISGKCCDRTHSSCVKWHKGAILGCAYECTPMPLAACTMQGEGRSANPCTNTPCTRSSFRSGRHRHEIKTYDSNGSNLVTYNVRIARNRSIKQPRGAYVLDHTCDTVLERETRSIAGFRIT